MDQEKKIKILPNGPYQFKGNIPLNQLSYSINALAGGMEFNELQKYETSETYFLCRCGRTGNYPYCDGSHIQEPSFDGTETASTEGVNEPAEDGLEKEASLLENLAAGVHGPVMVKGGIPVEGSNGNYAIRNRMSLCTCGKSKNKPFCDGSHMNK